MALSEGLELLADTTADQRARWQKARAEGSLTSANFGTAAHVDTVGAVALDDDGNLAAGSSTGGVFGKLPGRVGDACLFGAGVYASQAAAAVGTGVGELFIETLASYQAGRLIEDGAHPQEACEQVIERLGRTRRTSAGLLALDVNGRAGAAYRGGSWSVFGPDGRLEGTRLT
jgi:beta-aspartyl-peptidase (threonine type)